MKLCWILSVLLLASGCDSGGAPSQNQSNGAQIKQEAQNVIEYATAPQLEPGLQRVVEQSVAEYGIARCADGYYYFADKGNDYRYIEARQLTVSISLYPPSDADRLNGLSARAYGQTKCDVRRSRSRPGSMPLPNDDGQWSAWQECHEDHNYWSMTFDETGNGWAQDYPSTPVTPTCPDGSAPQPLRLQYDVAQKSQPFG
ncbi:MAG: hypothetical protein ABUS57_00540 [Pseudomonadota bacterium]